MNAALAPSLAAYTPPELDDLAEAVAMLQDCAALPADRAARDRIDAALRKVIERGMDAARPAGQAAVLRAFPAPH